MKRETLILQTMNDTQVMHAKRILDREVARRPGLAKAMKKSSQSGEHRVGHAVRKKTGT